MLYTAGKYSYEYIDDWAKCPEGWSLHDAVAVSIDSQDKVYVFSRGSHPITVFDREGNLLDSWGQGLFKSPHGVFVGSDGSVYCADTRHHTVSKFTPDGKLLMELGNKDQPSDTGHTGFAFPSRPLGFYEKFALIRDNIMQKTRVGPPFNAPTGVFVSDSGEIYVADGYHNAQIHKFSPDGTLLLSWGELGDGPGQFVCAHSVWVDKNERVWITDRENYRIQIYDARGKFLDQWTDLALPCHIFIDDDETVYIPEALCQRVSMFTIEGKPLARWYNQGDQGDAPLSCPHVTAVDSRGDLYVANTPVAMWRRNLGCKSIAKFARRN